MEVHDDYLDVTSSIQIALDSELGKEVLDSEEYGAEIMYLLGNDPDLYSSISKMSGKQLTKAIGKLEASLEKKLKPKPKSKSKVPEPANINRRGTKYSGKPDINKMTPDEYYRLSCAG